MSGHKVQTQGVNALTHQIAQRLMHESMSCKARQTSQTRALETHMHVRSTTGSTGMAGMQGAVITQDQRHHRAQIWASAQPQLHFGQKG